MGPELIVPLMLAGTGVAAYGMYQQRQAAKQEGKNAQAIANYNAQIARQEAESKAQAAESAAEQQKRRGDILRSQIIGGVGKSGVALSGAPLTSLIDTEQQLGLEYLNILKGASNTRAFGESQAQGIELQGKSYAISGKNAARGATLGAFGGIASGIGNAYYSKYSLKSMGAFDNKTT